MNIAHVVPTYLPATRYGGPIHSVHGLCRALAARGHRVQVFTTNTDGDGRSDVPVGEAVDLDGVSVHYAEVPRLRRLYYAPGLARALRDAMGAIDVLHLHSVYLWPTLIAARAARRHGIPYLLAPRGMLDEVLIDARGALRKRAWIALCERRNLRGAFAIHATSALEARQLVALGLDLAPVKIIPNGVDLPARRDLPMRDENHLLFLGRVTYKKGLDVLIRALAELPDAVLTVAGPDDEGYGAELDELATALGVRERVRFVGLVDTGERDRLLARATMMVLPSRSENFANVVVEAMALGCPVLLSPAVGVAEQAVAQGAAALCEVDASAVAASARALLADAPRRRRMGEAGEQAARQRFAWPAVAQSMEALYEGAVAHRRRA